MKLISVIHFCMLLTYFSCDIKEKKDTPLNSIPDSPNSIPNTKKIDTIPVWGNPKTLNYDNWEIFWKAFTIATEKKDTTTVTELTNFPFVQNSYPSSQDEFVESWITQTFDIKTDDSSVPSSGLGIPIAQEEETKISQKIDSFRYMYKNGKDFYFGKVNGYYRLIVIVTPG